MFDIDEKDWKVLRKKVPMWQESYMEKLVKEYSELLESDALASEKFWALENRIFNDKKKRGVVIDMRRSLAKSNVIDLINEGVITQDDLADFSEDFQNFFKLMYK